MATPKNILLISGFRIFPTNTGGHIRTASITRALARMGYRVLIYSLAARNGDYNVKGSLRSPFRVEHIEPNLTEETHLGLGYGLMQTIGRRLKYPRVWQYQLLQRAIVPARLKQHLHEADIVLSDMPWCPRVRGPWMHKPWFLLSHNLEYRLLEQGDGHFKKSAPWMRAVETAAPQEFTDILACAEEDQNFFRACDTSGARKVPILRGGVDPHSYVAAPGSRERIRTELGIGENDHLLVFAGSTHGPNLEALAALQEFCRAEAAFLQRERVYFLMLGSMCPNAMREGALIATGRVPEVVSYFAAADAGLNPITSGSGANVKIFEYLAARLPIISTHFGVRGTTLEPDRDFLPYTHATLKTAIERFIREKTHLQWRDQAEEVWKRHRSSCDIKELVRDAIAQLPAFG